jgi:hypothetical protein
MSEKKKQQSEFAGFIANPRALRRGGAAVSAARSQKRRGLLERIAQAEVNRYWRAEIRLRADGRLFFDRCDDPAGAEAVTAEAANM